MGYMGNGSLLCTAVIQRARHNSERTGNGKWDMIHGKRETGHGKIGRGIWEMGTFLSTSSVISLELPPGYPKSAKTYKNVELQKIIIKRARIDATSSTR